MKLKACLSGLCRLQREGVLDAASQGEARQDLRRMAAAFQWCGNAPAVSDFVTLDRRLGESASKEGFTVLP